MEGNRIKIDKENNVTVYDERGNEIHYKGSNGFEYWREYDDKGNMIHHKDHTRWEQWFEYDERGNNIHYKDSYGYEVYSKYDENNNCIHYKNSTGAEVTLEYTEKEDTTTTLYPDGSSLITILDKEKNILHLKYSDGKEEYYKCKDGVPYKYNPNLEEDKEK